MDKKKLKRYKIVVDDESEMQLVSIVKDPAIQVSAMLFNKQKPLLFKSDKEKKEIQGPILIPDLPILRYDESNKEYFEVIFDAESIEKLVEKYQKVNNKNKINFNHSDRMVDGYVKEIWIKTSTHDKSVEFYPELPIGSAFMTVKVEDDNFWMNEIKDLGYQSFSVEILAGFELMEFEEIRGNVNSSNVDNYLYDTVTEELIITFNSGESYKYFDITFDEFNAIRFGEGVCITEGSNQYGDWYVGKTPSVGAAVYSYLVDANRRYIKLSNIELSNILIDLMSDNELKEVIESFIVEPGVNETEDEFISRCMKIETNNYPQDQSYAICKSKWDKR